jgi:hypothetical protein
VPGSDQLYELWGPVVYLYDLLEGGEDVPMLHFVPFMPVSGSLRIPLAISIPTQEMSSRNSVFRRRYTASVSFIVRYMRGEARSQASN